MASESEPESGPAGASPAVSSEAPPRAQAAPSDRPKKKKAKRPRLPIPRTEEEIDSPTKQTIGMLGILCAMTVIMWAFARGACNYHPPKETRVPRKVPLAELAHDPKNAAIELQQRWLTRDFDGALELASGNVTQQIQQDKAACDAACLAKRPELEKTVLTSAELLDVNPLGGTVRVTSVGLPEGKKSYLMHLERGDTLWKANERTPDTGAPFVPQAQSAESPVAPAPSAAPAGSGKPTLAASGAPKMPAPAASH
jgi:hypothetical protein